MLLGNLAGISAADFQAAAQARPDRAGHRRRARVGSQPRAAGPESTRQPDVPLPLAADAISTTAQFTAALTKLISAKLGLRGFTLTLAVEKAGTIEELRDVANRALEQIRERKGEAVAADARRTLYGA